MIWSVKREKLLKRMISWRKFTRNICEWKSWLGWRILKWTLRSSKWTFRSSKWSLRFLKWTLRFLKWTLRSLGNFTSKPLTLVSKFEFFSFDRSSKASTISLSNRIIYKLSIFFMSEYIYLHNFRRIYVNVKTREVTVNVNGKQESIVKRYFNCFTRKYFVSKENLEKIYDIISNRDHQNCFNISRRHWTIFSFLDRESENLGLRNFIQFYFKRS